jgi:hypothetical protein
MDMQTDRRKGSTRQAVYDLAVGGGRLAATLLLAPLLRRSYNRHGATDDELRRTLPGDGLVPRPKLGYTRAITIDAPVEAVWPWLVQFGQGRGGFYSYDTLENLIGCDIRSVDAILPEHQDLHVGDLIRSGRDSMPCWQVVEVAPPRHLVLIGAGTPAAPQVPEIVEVVPDRGYVASTWQWVLEPTDGNRRTRLIVRQRETYSPNQAWLWHLVEPFNFVMEHRMLQGIRQRAEGRQPTKQTRRRPDAHMGRWAEVVRRSGPGDQNSSQAATAPNSRL